MPGRPVRVEHRGGARGEGDPRRARRRADRLPAAAEWFLFYFAFIVNLMLLLLWASGRTLKSSTLGNDVRPLEGENRVTEAPELVCLCLTVTLSTQGYVLFSPVRVMLFVLARGNEVVSKRKAAVDTHTRWLVTHPEPRLYVFGSFVEVH